MTAEPCITEHACVAPARVSGRLPGLDMLRGVAALSVVALHLEWIFGIQPRVFAKGYLAVDLFFMLSGYVMARTYEPRFGRGLGPWAFLFARYRRLWPVMAIGAAIGLPKLLLDSHSVGDFGLTAGLNLLLLPAPWKTLAFPLNIPAWSISFELLANLVHALLLWRLGGRWLLILVMAMIPLTALSGTIYGDLDIGARSSDYLSGLPRIVLSYTIGVILWRWWHDTPSIPIPPLLAFGAMPALFAAAGLVGTTNWRFDLAFILAACPLMIAGGLHYGSRSGALASAAAAVGALSFPLYAVHMPIIQGLRMLGFGPLVAGLAAITCGAAIAVTTGALARRRKVHQGLGGSSHGNVGDHIPL